MINKYIKLTDKTGPRTDSYSSAAKWTQFPHAMCSYNKLEQLPKQVLLNCHLPTFLQFERTTESD